MMSARDSLKYQLQLVVYFTGCAEICLDKMGSVVASGQMVSDFAKRDTSGGS